MDIISSKNGRYTLSFLKEEHPAVCRITSEYAKALLCKALKICTLPNNTVIELFENGDNILLFADIPPAFYAFDDLETVISACMNCTSYTSSLFHYDGKYILSVPFPIPVLNEFAFQLNASRSYDLFLKEHGSTIISDNAVNFVKNTF